MIRPSAIHVAPSPAPRRLGGWLLAAWLGGLGCHPGPTAPTGAQPAASLRALHYEIALDAGLRELTTTVCMRGHSRAHLRPGRRRARRALRQVWVRRGGQWRAMALPSRRGIPLARAGEDGCVRYRLDLPKALEASHLSRSEAGGVTAATPTWLWGPRPRPPGLRVSARVSVPEGIQASLPWPRRSDGTHVLDASAFDFVGYAAFGRLQTEVVDAACGRLEVAVVGEAPATLRAQIVPWLRAQARAATQLTGCLPAPRIHVVVVPVGAGGPAVPFGMVGRGGGKSMLLLLSRDARLEALVDDWVAVHEMTHMHVPFVRREDAWLAEGLATYYQELLRARAGMWSEAQLWRALDRGLRRGFRASGPSLAAVSRRMHETGRFQQVYWGGAAYMLKADVQLRLATDGARSLDDVVAALSACCRDSTRVWTAAQLLARMDAVAGVPVFTRLYRAEVLRRPFPELEEVYARLGLERRPEGLRLRHDTAALRQAIIRGGPSALSAR